MTRLIDSSIEGVIDCNVSLTMSGKLKIALPYGWNSHALGGWIIQRCFATAA